MLHSLIFSTLGQLASGILLFIGFVPPSKIGQGFGRFHAVLVFSLWLAATWGSFSKLFFLLTFLLALLFLSSSRDRWYYPALFAAFVVSVYLLLQKDIPTLGFTNSMLIHFPPLLVLGASSVSMLLGHWYLVAPKLSISYLKWVTIALIASLLLRGLFLSGVIAKTHSGLMSSHFYDIYGFFLIQRVALGIVLTLTLSVLTYYCVRIRSTQSATGILYVVVVFCLVGEIIGSFLFRKTGIYF